MPTILERSDQASTDELEALWAAPCGSEPEAPAVAAEAFASRRDRVQPWLDHGLRAGWLAMLAVVLLLAPAPQAGAAIPIWTEALSTAALLVLVGGAVLLGNDRAVPAYACGIAAGAAGTVLGLGCRATEHHAGSWWLYETVGFTALTVLAVAALLRSSGGWRSGRVG